MADYGLLSGIARGLQAGVESYDRATEKRLAKEKQEYERKRDEEELERKRKKDQQDLDISLTKEDLELGEDGKPRLSKTGKLKRRMSFYEKLDEGGKASSYGKSLAEQIAAELSNEESGGEVTPQTEASGLISSAPEAKKGLIDLNPPPGFLNKEARAEKRQFKMLDERDRLANARKLEEEARKPVLDQISKLATSSAEQAHVHNMLVAGSDQISKLTDPDQIVRAGNELLKAINAGLGRDAIGVDEAARMGDALQYKIANLTKPGPMFGRDIEGFKKQLKNSIDRLAQGIKTSQEQVKSLQEGKGLVLKGPAPAKAPPKPGDTEKGYRFKGGDPKDKNNWEKVQ